MIQMGLFDNVVSGFMNTPGMGGTITLIRQTDGEYDTETSSFPIIETNYTLKALVFDYTLQSNGESTKMGTLIEVGDKQVMIQPPIKSYPNDGSWLEEIVPASDRIVWNGNIWRIVTFKQINPSGSNSVLWELLIRK